MQGQVQEEEQGLEPGDQEPGMEVPGTLLMPFGHPLAVGQDEDDGGQDGQEVGEEGQGGGEAGGAGAGGREQEGVGQEGDTVEYLENGGYC